jgi:predicted esterase
MNFKFEIPYGNNVETINRIKALKSTMRNMGRRTVVTDSRQWRSIESMGNQIDYFKTKYIEKVNLETDSLTYAQITRDWDGLVNLKLDSISIVGWSDGGIIGLEMGVW